MVARSHQGEAVDPRMGTCIRGSEEISTGKDSGWIGTSEVNVAIDNRVPLSLDRRGHGNGKGGTHGCCGGSCEVKNRVRGSTA